MPRRAAIPPFRPTARPTGAREHGPAAPDDGSSARTAAGAVRRPRAAAALPAYALYGEPAPALAAEPLHVETIAERSRRHDWEIRPHRHGAMFQLLLVRRGRVSATLDGVALELRGPAVVTVPALGAHGFRFDRRIQGRVVTVAAPHLERLLAPAPGLAARLTVLRGWPLAATAAPGIDAAADALAAEYRAGPTPGIAATAAPGWRALALDAALLRLLIAVGRGAPPDAGADAGPPRALQHVRRLRAAIEREFRRQPTLAALAGEVGVTPTQLNRACRAVLGQPTLALLHERLLREAQRELAYTGVSIKRIALELGFSDAAYFTRFVRRHVGLTPSAWRSRLRP